MQQCLGVLRIGDALFGCIVTLKRLLIYCFVVNAEVAELVDALGSGSSGLMPVGVQISPSAPLNKIKGLQHIAVTPFFV